jgi:hypothetical protein
MGEENFAWANSTIHRDTWESTIWANPTQFIEMVEETFAWGNPTIHRDKTHDRKSDHGFISIRSHQTSSLFLISISEKII